MKTKIEINWWNAKTYDKPINEKVKTRLMKLALKQIIKEIALGKISGNLELDDEFEGRWMQT